MRAAARRSRSTASLKKPIKYIGVGEKTDALEEFHPERMAGRILQQGDIVSLVEKAQDAFDADEAKRLEKKVRKEGMDLEDFLTAMKQMQKLGPLEGLLKMLPGVNSKMLKQAKMDPKRMKHIEAIVLSMTPEERKKPEIMNGSRRARIAKGCGPPGERGQQAARAVPRDAEDDEEDGGGRRSGRRQACCRRACLGCGRTVRR